MAGTGKKKMGEVHIRVATDLREHLSRHGWPARRTITVTNSVRGTLAGHVAFVPVSGEAVEIGRLPGFGITSSAGR